MNRKGIFIILALVSLLLGGNSFGQPFGAANDLWDLSGGTVVTANTPVQFGSATYLLGGGAGTEGSTYFPDAMANGFIHSIEWRTPAAVTVGQIKLYASGDGPQYSNGREFARFVLKAKTPGSSTFDQTILTFVPTHPYTFIGSPLNLLILATNVPAFTAQEFRAEFEHVNLRSEGFNGPRINELDAFGPPDPQPPVVTITSPAAGPVGSAVTLAGTVTDNLGVSSARWELNGQAMGALTLNSGSFSVPSIGLIPGTNRFRVIGVDTSLNETSAEVTVTSTRPEISETPNLVAFYGFDGDSLDSGINQYDGTNNGAVSALNRYGRTDTALFFNGSSNLVNCGNPAGFNFTSNFTVAAWVKLNGAQPSKYLVAKYAGGDGVSVPPHSWGLGLENGSSRLFGFVSGNGPGFSSTAGGTTLANNAWHAIVFVYDNSFGLRLYLDGAQVGTVSAPGLAPFVNDAPLTIGGLVSQQFFGGHIDSVRLFDRALSASEIKVDFDYPVDAPPDLEAPVVSISTPVSGAVGSHVLVSGTITDDVMVVSNRWELNGVLKGSLTLTSNSFSVVSSALAIGTNVIRVYGYDATGKVGSSQVTVTYAPPITDSTGLIAYYKMDGNGNDSSSNHIDGVVLGAQARVDRWGLANGALQFDGITNVINCGDNTGFTFGTNFTVSAWVRMTNSQAGKFVVAKYASSDGTAVPPHSWALGFDSLTARVYASVSANGPGSLSATGGTAPTNGAWHAVSFGYDNTFGIRLYLNGVQVATRSAPAFAPFVNSAPLTIGGLLNQRSFEGSIDSVRIFNRVRTAAEILSEYNNAPDRPNDTSLPVVTITSPGPIVTNTSVVLSGTVTDNLTIVTQRWELNGVTMTGLTFGNGTFSAALTGLRPGTNTIKVFATDAVSNVGSNQISVFYVRPDPSVENGLVAYYPFDGDAVDLSSNRYDGLVIGAVPTANRYGQSNKALLFNGASDVVNCGNVSGFNFASNFTVAAWVRLNGDQSMKYFIAKYAGGDGVTVPPHSWGFGTEVGTSRIYSFLSGNSSSFSHSEGGASLNNNAWHAIAYVYDNSFGLRLYVDGAQVGSTPAAGLAPITNNASLTIGGLISQQFFGGAIDEVRIYNRSLSAAEILTDYTYPADMVTDNDAPVVTITSPTPGIIEASSVVLQGTITDNVSLKTNSWTLNGTAKGYLQLNNGSFVVTTPELSPGENRITVTAIDQAGNQGSSSVVFTYRLPSITNGLVAYYELNGDAEDSSGHGLHGTNHGAVAIPSRGGGGTAMAFNGTSNYINCGNAAGFNFSGSFSVGAWVKLNGDQSMKYFVAKYAGGDGVTVPPHSWGFGLEQGTSRLYAFLAGEGTSFAHVEGGPTLNNNAWHAVVLVYDNSFGLRLYVDGTQVGSRSAPGLAPIANNAPLTIGGLVSQQFFGGAVDDVRIYDRALSGAEISAQYLAPTVLAQIGVTTDLFDVQQGTVLTASSGLQSSTSDPGMFGGADDPSSPITTLFSDDKPNGFNHSIEWRTARPVTLNQIKLYAEGDGAAYDNGREFARFTLKAKSPGSSVFDRTIVSFAPPHPYLFTPDRLILDTNFTAVTAQEFRGEFEQGNLRAAGWNAPRVIELDAFGPPPSPAPSIFQEPASFSILPGATGIFSVSVIGDLPLNYQWLRNGTNLILSSHIQSPDGKTLVINNVTAADVGAYSVAVTNQYGHAESLTANLSLIVDTNAPTVAITSPSSGASGLKSITVQGTVADNYGVASVRWERNGIIIGAVAITNGAFNIPVQLLSGSNAIKVVARDSTGNEGSAEILMVLSPTAQANDDLWDLSRGTVVTANSGTFSETTPGLFGGSGYYADGSGGRTLFADNKTNGFAHFVEWRTTNAVTISTVRLFAGGDGPSWDNGREFAKFTLKVRSPGSSTFDQTVFTFVPTHPYQMIDAESFLILETNVPAFTAQDFRAEFEQANLRSIGNGPRIMELDAFGPTLGGAPQIVSQPAARESFTGTSATFLVGVTGSAPFAYQWRHAGTNLPASSKFAGVNSWSLTVSNLTAADAGAYSVVVTNLQGQATSDNAQLTVSVDSTPPVVAITSPAAGAQTNGTFVLDGTVADANLISSVRVEINDRAPQQLTLSNGRFRVSGLTFDLGENRVKVIAIDAAGNEGTAQVITTWTVPRALVLSTPLATQDGASFSVPVILVSTGHVSSATFTVDFDVNYLANASIVWRDSVVNSFTSTNLTNGRIKATFALIGSTIPAGAIPIATLNFRARSVPSDLQTELHAGLLGIYSDTGAAYENNNSVISTFAKITKRKITGDNNANDRLDVGDASSILRLVTGLDPIRSWDHTLNDLNLNGSVDAGDAIRVLRAVVELDPQPTLPVAAAGSAPVASLSKKAFKAAAGVSLTLLADKPTVSPGDRVTVEVRLANGSNKLSGASFRLDYPATAFAIEGSTSLALGSIVPPGTAFAWNTTQNGSVSLALSGPTAWDATSGVLTRITFLVQPGITSQGAWPLAVLNGTLAREDGSVESLAGGTGSIARAPQQPRFTSSITFNGTTPRLTLQGDNGASYLIEASSDLHNWDRVGTAITANGSVVIDDPAGAGATSRYYRATFQP